MIDIRNEVRQAFDREQSAAPPPAALRAQVVATVGARAHVPARLRSEQSTHWLMVGAAVLLTIAVVGGLMAVRYATQRPSVVRPGPAPERCLPGSTWQPGSFARVHGCITYSDGLNILAVDPNHPTNKISMGPSNGQLPLAWSRDGNRLLLMSIGDLYVMDGRGTRTRLTNGDAYGWEGSFSPDGTQVAFDRVSRSAPSTGHPPTKALYVVNAGGGPARLLVESNPCTVPVGEVTCSQSNPGWEVGYPAWSPDGSHISYVVYRLDLGTDEVWTINVDGSGRHRLVDLQRCGGGQGAGCTDLLAWSPDGSRLAIHTSGGIYIVRADGSGKHLLTDKGAQPAWSPDGSRIAFTRDGDLFTMAADGSDVKQVAGVVIVPPYGWTWNPARD